MEQFLQNNSWLVLCLLGIGIILAPWWKRIGSNFIDIEAGDRPPLPILVMTTILGLGTFVLGIAQEEGWFKGVPHVAPTPCQSTPVAASAGDDPRLEYSLEMSPNTSSVPLGTMAHLGFSVKNYGSVITRPFHVYVEGQDPEGKQWGSLEETAQLVLLPGASQHFWLLLEFKKVGVYRISNLQLKDDRQGVWWGPLPTGSCRPWFLITVTQPGVIARLRDLVF